MLLSSISSSNYVVQKKTDEDESREVGCRAQLRFKMANLWARAEHEVSLYLILLMLTMATASSLQAVVL